MHSTTAIDCALQGRLALKEVAQPFGHRQHTRHVTEAGLNLIKRFEGFSSTIYICPAGYPTIGYGHVVLANELEQFAAGITSAQATELLRKDVKIAE